MKTLQQFALKPESIPTAVSWYLTDLAEARGRQDLFARQALQKLKALREHALIESAVSSNRIEGVVVDQRRIGTLVFGKPLLRDRSEEEVRGYRDALKLIHYHREKPRRPTPGSVQNHPGQGDSPSHAGAHRTVEPVPERAVGPSSGCPGGFQPGFPLHPSVP